MPVFRLCRQLQAILHFLPHIMSTLSDLQASVALVNTNVVALQVAVAAIPAQPVPAATDADLIALKAQADQAAAAIAAVTASLPHA